MWCGPLSPFYWMYKCYWAWIWSNLMHIIGRSLLGIKCFYPIQKDNSLFSFILSSITSSGKEYGWNHRDKRKKIYRCRHSLSFKIFSQDSILLHFNSLDLGSVNKPFSKFTIKIVEEQTVIQSHGFELNLRTTVKLRRWVNCGDTTAEWHNLDRNTSAATLRLATIKWRLAEDHSFTSLWLLLFAIQFSSSSNTAAP